MSDLLKIARAVDGDEWFPVRVKIACELAGVPYGRERLLQVASGCVEEIQVDEFQRVDTTGVQDDTITAAVTALTAPATEEETA